MAKNKIDAKDKKKTTKFGKVVKKIKNLGKHDSKAIEMLLLGKIQAIRESLSYRINSLFERLTISRDLRKNYIKSQICQFHNLYYNGEVEIRDDPKNPTISFHKKGFHTNNLKSRERMH